MRKFTSYRIGLLAAAGVALGAFAALPAAAQGNEPVSMTRSVIPFDESVTVLGQADSQAMVSFTVALKLRDYHGLAASNAAGKVMSSAQMARDHLPTSAAYDKVLNWATTAGLTVSQTSKSRMTVELTGPVAVVSRALGVTFSNVRSGGEQLIATQATPSLPRSIASSVQSVNGLQPYQHAFKIGSHVDSATTVPYYAQAFTNAYGAAGLGLGGKGVTTAIVIDVFPLITDLKAYYQQIGSTQKTANTTLIHTTNVAIGQPGGEESMDAEVSSGIAPKAKTRVYASGDLKFKNLDKSFQAIVDDMNDSVKITQVSISLGGCERKTASGTKDTDDNFFAVMSGLGASVFVSTGDSGSRECGTETTSFFATSPNVTGAGGTSLSLNSSTGAVTGETGWSGSGGGVSSYFATPTYQSGLGFPMRAIPDISADANPQTGALVIVKGSPHTIGGTSLSAPILAGLFALANADRIKHHKAPLGLVNSRIYSLPASNFRDVTNGNNGDYTAGAGYDLVTGLGAPLMNNLIPALTAQP